VVRARGRRACGASGAAAAPRVANPSTHRRRRPRRAPRRRPLARPRAHARPRRAPRAPRRVALAHAACAHAQTHENSLYNNIVTPSKLIHGTDFHLFKEGIEPKWEDPKCARGGKWTFSAPKTSNRNSLDTYWLNTVRLLRCLLRCYWCYAAPLAMRACALERSAALRCARSACARAANPSVRFSRAALAPTRSRAPPRNPSCWR
jgi:hypothetical protein